MNWMEWNEMSEINGMEWQCNGMEWMEWNEMNDYVHSIKETIYA